MNRLSLTSVLLPILVTPFIMTYRISPGETPYWLFGIIFLLLLVYLVFDLVLKNKERYQSVLLWFIVIVVIGSAYVSAVIVRHQTSVIYGIHDITLQQESAIRFLLHGKNPYSSTYFGTPLEEWNYSTKELNPALFHFVMMPWYLIFSLPFYAVAVSTLGFFDGRIPLVFLFFTTLFLAWKILAGNQEKKRQFVALLAFNPATLGYFLEGRADFFMFAFLFAAFFLLEKEKYFLSGIPMALAFATKQSVWPIFPFYFAYLFIKNRKSLNRALFVILPFAITFAVIVLPFFFWNQKAFLDSTLNYLSGNTANSYPIAGYGWGSFLFQSGFIKDIQAYYPFWIWQLIVCLPLGFLLLRWLIKTPTVWRLITCYGIFTFVFWYFSRYFNNSHLGYLSSVFLTAYFWQEKTQQ